MLYVGLTGGIGAGKSAVSRLLSEHGALVIDADRLARAVVAPGMPGLARVVREFGPDVLRPDGSLDRARLGRLVFGDAAARERLNAIVHPLVAERAREIVASAPEDAVVVHEIPLLVETGQASDFDLVVVVEAAEHTRLERLVAKGMSESDARARMAAQAGDAERRAAADVVLANDGDPAALADAVDGLWRDHIAPRPHCGGPH